jgi:large subunit ribosomal protein L17
MAASLLEHGAIRTTEAKAKELRRFVEKLITVAKAGTLHARRRAIAKLGDRQAFDREGEELDQTVVQKLFDEIAPRYMDRPGGYTRIIRLADRRIGDAGRQVLLQLVEETGAREAGEPEGPSRRRRRATRRIEAAGAAEDTSPEEAPDQVVADAGDDEPDKSAAAEASADAGDDGPSEEAETADDTDEKKQ